MPLLPQAQRVGAALVEADGDDPAAEAADAIASCSPAAAPDVSIAMSAPRRRRPLERHAGAALGCARVERGVRAQRERELAAARVEIDRGHAAGAGEPRHLHGDQADRAQADHATWSPRCGRASCTACSATAPTLANSARAGGSSGGSGSSG